MSYVELSIDDYLDTDCLNITWVLSPGSHKENEHCTKTPAPASNKGDNHTNKAFQNKGNKLQNWQDITKDIRIIATHIKSFMFQKVFFQNKSAETITCTEGAQRALPLVTKKKKKKNVFTVFLAEDTAYTDQDIVIKIRYTCTSALDYDKTTLFVSRSAALPVNCYRSESHNHETFTSNSLSR